MIASSALGARRSQTMTSIVGSGPGSPVILAPTVSRTPRIGNGSEPMVSETTALTTMSTTRMITRGATGNRRSRSADRLKEGIAVPSGCEDLDARPERHKSCMGSSDFGSLSVGPSQNHSQWSSRRRHRHRCATVPDSHRVHRDLIGAAPCTRRRLAPVHATRDVPFRQPLAVAARQPRVAGASGTWNAAARGPGGAAGAVPRTPVAIRFDKTPRATPRGRHHDPQHICHGDERATPRIADKIHHAAPGTATGWPPPMRRGRSQEATTAKTVDAADERMRTRSRHRNVPRDGWYFAPPWYFGSTRPSVPRPVADPTVSNTSATNVSSYAGHSSTWTCRARSEAVLRTPVVFRFDKPPRATPRGKPHDPQHICHRIAGPRPARQTGPPPHPGPLTLSLTLQNLQCE